MRAVWVNLQSPLASFSESDNVIPDVVWASNERLERLLDEAGHLTAAPELVVEVLSPGKKNERRDREAKLSCTRFKGFMNIGLSTLRNKWLRFIAVRGSSKACSYSIPPG